MKGRLLQYGAGNIGRGFIGQIFSAAGYEVSFIDIDKQIIHALNKDGRYPVNIVSYEKNEEIWVENVRGIDGTDINKIAAEIAVADYMATAVGVNVLPMIASPIATGLKHRWATGNLKPLSIIICENMIDADQYLASLLEQKFTEKEKELFHQTIGLVEASIGRMVPMMPAEIKKENILRIFVEEYDELPIDKDAFVGELPDVPQVRPFSPFTYYIRRKLFLHNMGHAITAYLGDLHHYKYIWQAVGDSTIRSITENAMREVGLCLAADYEVDFVRVAAYIDDLLYRFGNKALGDTIHRVGQDTLRKLSPKDRLCGALDYCIRQGKKSVYIPLAIAAGLLFNDDSKGTQKVQEILKSQGAEQVLQDVCQVDEEHTLLILKYYKLLKSGINLNHII